MFARNSYGTAAIAVGSLLLSVTTGGTAQAQVSGALDNPLNSQTASRTANRTANRTVSRTATIAANTPVNYQTLYVDPALGNDGAGGVEAQPLQTVTRALELAEPNTVIVLAPGRYNQSSGEVFPLQLKSGVTIQGTPGVRDHTAIIEGGGNFESPLRSQQNAAIIAADRAGIAQVAVSNPNGYGVWIESASPTILESAFVGNRQTGIYVTDGSPRVQGSYFSGNQVAGLIVFGDSSANIQSNTFDRTGDAIRVVDGATPEIVGNRMTNNEAGLVLIGNARPLLRDNQSTGNRRNDVVEVSTADQQSFQPTTQLAVNRTSEPVVSRPAVSRSLAPEPAVEPVAEPVAEPVVQPIAESLAPEPAVEPVAEPAVEPVAEPVVSELIASVPMANRSSSRLLSDVNESEAEVAEAEAAVEADEIQADEVQASREIEPGAPGSALAALRSGLPGGGLPSSGGLSDGAAADLALAPRAVTEDNPDSAVIRPRNSRNQRAPEPEERSAPPVNNNRLAVPSSSIPIGDGESAFFAPPNTVSSRGLPAPTSRAQSLGLYYRVFVEASSSSAQDDVRSVVPDAFRTSFEGETVMQVGAFPTEEEAEDRKQMLEDNDLNARVEYIR